MTVTATRGRVSWYCVYNFISVLTSINKKKWQTNNLQRLSASQIVFWIKIDLIKKKKLSQFGYTTVVSHKIINPIMRVLIDTNI